MGLFLIGIVNAQQPIQSYCYLQAYLNGQPDMQGNDSLPLPFEDFYLTLDDNDLSKSYRLMACFRKDMHRVETFLTMAKCRRSPDSNCTLWKKAGHARYTSIGPAQMTTPSIFLYILYNFVTFFFS